MPQRSSLLSFLFFPLMGFLIAGCDKPCENAVCPANHQLNILLVDSLDQNLILSGVFTSDQVHLLSHKQDTLPSNFNTLTGVVSITPYQDQSQYSVIVGEAAYVDLTVYQHFAAPPNECCPGYWKIDSVYAYQEKLKEAPNQGGFVLKVD